MFRLVQIKKTLIKRFKKAKVQYLFIMKTKIKNVVNVELNFKRYNFNVDIIVKTADNKNVCYVKIKQQ